MSLQNTMGIKKRKNAKFVADFESSGKVAEKFLQKKWLTYN